MVQNDGDLVRGVCVFHANLRVGKPVCPGGGRLVHQKDQVFVVAFQVAAFDVSNRIAAADADHQGWAR